MAVISIIGTSGSGKSFLVKQLSSLNNSPAFFEGEEGTIPKEILENIFSGDSPVGRWEYFMNRYKENISKAKTISESGINVYVDGSNITPWSIIIWEEEKYREEIKKLISILDDLDSDVNLFLKINEKKT